MANTTLRSTQRTRSTQAARSTQSSRSSQSTRSAQSSRSPQGTRSAQSSRSSQGTRATQGSGASRKSSAQDRFLFGVPARFMAPRLIFIGAVLALVAFGVMMIYSSSSITALSSSNNNYNPAFFLSRQVGFVVGGLVLMGLEIGVGYQRLIQRFLPLLWTLALISLIIVFTPIAGQDANGATRWIQIGPMSLQPSEFVKITVILTAADVLSKSVTPKDWMDRTLLHEILYGIVVPMAFIFFQPDKGTVLVLGLTLFAMAYFSGFPMKGLVPIFLIAVAAFVIYSLKDSYSRQRFLTMLDPWADEWKSGYQLIAGFLAFASGGLGGVGVGMSRQKYSYLPYAYNDFIFAVIGEELGFVGCVLMFVGFGAACLSGLRIAKLAPNLQGMLVASGATLIIIFQLLLNVCGVLGIIPLSGKPIPFISYGGSSIISSLLLAGLVISVSLSSRLPKTTADRARASFRLREDGAGAPAAGGTENARALLVNYDEHGVGEPHVRGARGTAPHTEPTAGLRKSTTAPSQASSKARTRLTVVGTNDRASASARSTHSSARNRSTHSSAQNRSTHSSARDRSTQRAASSRTAPHTSGMPSRINLGPSASERLRGKDAPSQRK